MGMPRASTTSRVQHVDYASFLAHIHSSGRLAVGREFGLSTDGLVAALQQLDEIVRIDGPSDLPELDLDAAVWGVARLHAACVLLAHRDHGVEVIEQQMLAACPSAWSAPATHYSVDLSLRHLPDVWRLARVLGCHNLAMSILSQSWPTRACGACMSIASCAVKTRNAHKILRSPPPSKRGSVNTVSLHGRCSRCTTS
jgi:hypothetical protein